MAAVLVPLIGTIAPLIAELALSEIQKAEAYFPKGSGAFKMATVAGTVLKWLQALGGAGVIQQAPPPQDQLETIIEGVLATLKSQNLLPAPGSGAAGLATVAIPTATLASPALVAQNSDVIQGMLMAQVILAAMTKQAGITT